MTIDAGQHLMSGATGVDDRQAGDALGPARALRRSRSCVRHKTLPLVTMHRKMHHNINKLLSASV
jgi:hypothetical protein